MLYQSAQDWRDATHKRVLFYGMSGLGKTYLSNMLRGSGDWFHYSIDYRIGTRYMREHITDSCIKAAMDQPYLREMLLQDAIYIAPNVHTHDLGAVSTYLGKPGDPSKGGLPIEDYRQRQDQFRHAEHAALKDTAHFISRAETLYGYPHFVCDTGGSICEWVDGDDPTDPLLTELSKHCLLVYLKGSEAHTQKLIRRFDRAPKPMAYQPEFLDAAWHDYLEETGTAPDKVDPDAFIRWTYARALAHRKPRYDAMAKWGVTLTADEVAGVSTAQQFLDMVATSLERRARPSI